MSDLSDIDVSNGDFSSDDESRNDIDPVGNSSEDDDPKVAGMLAIKRAKSELERDRRDHLSRLFNFLQEVVMNGKPRKESWKRIVTVCRALKVCEDLKAEEIRLSIEMESLLIENWKLRRQLTSLEKKKKRKAVSATLTRRVSSLSLTPPKLTLSEKRRVSMDDTKIKDLNPVNETPEKLSLKKEEPAINSEKLLISRPRKKLKKRSGLSEEEKELYTLEEKIEDLLSQVDCIWNEVKDDEEFGDDEILDDKKDLDKKRLLLADNQGESQELNPKKKTKNSMDSPKFISVTDISKLMNPQFLLNSKEVHPEKIVTKPATGLNKLAIPKLNIIEKGGSSEKLPKKPVTNLSKAAKPQISLNSKKKSSKKFSMKPVPSLLPINKESSKDDELVSEESDPLKKTNEDFDLMEALQAVDNLCRKIIPDVDEPSPSELEVKSVQGKKPVRKTRNSKRLSEIIVLDDE